MTESTTQNVDVGQPLDWRYRSLWRAVPRDLGYLLPSLPIALIGSMVLTGLFSVGVSLAFFFVGLFIGLAALYTARWWGSVEIARLGATGLAAIEPPEWANAKVSSAFT